jgi:hypothetical protein
MKDRDDPEYDQLFKVRPFLDSIKPSLREAKVEEYNRVDELVIPLKGQSSLKQEQTPQMGSNSISSCWFQWNTE